MRNVFEQESLVPIAMRAGATIDYQLSLFGLRFQIPRIFDSRRAAIKKAFA